MWLGVEFLHLKESFHKMFREVRAKKVFLASSTKNLWSLLILIVRSLGTKIGLVCAGESWKVNIFFSSTLSQCLCQGEKQNTLKKRTHWLIWRSQTVSDGLKVIDHQNISGWMMLFPKQWGILLSCYLCIPNNCSSRPRMWAQGLRFKLV